MIITIRGNTPSIPDSSFIAPGAQVIGNVSLGEEVGVWFNAVLRGDINKITIGRNTNVQDCSVLHVDSNDPLTIGENVTIGHNAIVHGATVKDRCLIGAGSVIFNQAVIGEDSMIAAGALVSPGKVIPAGSLVVGVPGKVVRELNEEEKKGILDSAKHYTALMKEYKALHIRE